MPPPPQTHLRKCSPSATEAILQQQEEGSRAACPDTRVRPRRVFLRAKATKQHQPLPALPPHKRLQCLSSHPCTETNSAHSAWPPLSQRPWVQSLLSCTAWQQIPWEAHGPQRAAEPHTEPPQRQAELPPFNSSSNTMLWLSHALFALVPSPSHLARLPVQRWPENLTWDCCISSAFLAEAEHLHCFCLLHQPAFCCRKLCLHVAACNHNNLSNLC